MFKYFTKCLGKFATLKGRARRKEFWSFILISTILQSIFVGVYSGMFGMGEEGLEKIAKFIFIIPTIAVSTRRLHDIGRSGWWNLLFPTGIGTIILFFMWCTEGDRYDNEYGPDPKVNDYDCRDRRDRRGKRKNKKRWNKKRRNRKGSEEDYYV